MPKITELLGAKMVCNPHLPNVWTARNSISCSNTALDNDGSEYIHFIIY
jgi:hypothetical protein